MSMPKFEFSSMELKSDDALNEALKDASSGEAYFKPGRHEVQIISSEYKGTANDPSWGKVIVTFEGVGGKTMSDLLLVPFRDITQFKGKNGDNQTLPGRRLKDFLLGLGVQVTIKTLGDTLKEYFGKDNGLKGLNIALEVGYRGNHVKYLGKGADGTQIIGLVNRDGVALEGVPTFSDYPTANAYAESNNIVVKRFVDVLRYAVSVTPNKRPSTDW